MTLFFALLEQRLKLLRLVRYYLDSEHRKLDGLGIGKLYIFAIDAERLPTA